MDTRTAVMTGFFGVATGTLLFDFCMYCFNRWRESKRRCYTCGRPR